MSKHISIYLFKISFILVLVYIHNVLAAEKAIGIDSLQDANTNAIFIHQDTYSEKQSLKKNNELSVGYNQAYVSDLDSYWYYSSLRYSHSTNNGTYSAFLNSAKRYGKTGFQYKIEAFPQFTKNIRAQFNFAYSGSSQQVFPKYQYIIEPYLFLPHNFEISLGHRYLRSLEVNIYTYTGSLGYYFGSYYLWFRPYHYTPKSTNFYECGIGKSFYNDAYLSLKLASGKIPDIADLPPLNQIIILRTNLIGISGKVPLTKNVLVQAGANYMKNQFNTGKTRRVTDGSIALLWRF